jgi:hypothetical protein
MHAIPHAKPPMPTTGLGIHGGPFILDSGDPARKSSGLMHPPPLQI